MITESTDIDAKNHAGGTATVHAQEATCGKTGYTGDTVCSGCGVTLEYGREIPATGEHDYQWKETKTATCVEKGERTGTCSVCGNVTTESTDIDAKNHVGGTSTVHAEEATCGKKGYTGDTICSSCETILEYGKDIPATGKHDYQWKETKTATCMEKGERTGTCSVCGDVITEATDIDANNHVGGTATVRAAEATCGKAGYTGDTICNGCEAVLEAGEDIPATGNHTWDDGEITKKATCTQKGTRKFVCTVCGAEKTEETDIDRSNHNGPITVKYAYEANCGNVGYTGLTVCEACNTILKDGEEIPATGEHTWVDSEITKEATCVQTGTQKFVCTVCGKVKTEEIAIDPDNHEALTTIGAREEDCGNPGFSGEIRCDACNKIVDKGHLIPATEEHIWGDGEITKEATCIEKGKITYTCTVCGMERTEETAIDPSNHAGQEILINEKESDCTEDGYSGDIVCEACRTVLKEGTVIPNLGGHVWLEGGITKEATCGEAGKQYYVCKNCGCFDQREIPATGEHSWDEGTITKDATCSEAGIMRYVCSVCGEVKDETIPATGDHTWDKGAVTKAASMLETGVKTYTCTVCGTTKKVTIDKLPATITLPDNAPASNPVSQDSTGMVGQNTTDTDKKITATKSDEIKGAVYQLLKLRYSKLGSTSLSIKWNKVSGATGYIVYGAKCGSKFVKLKKTTGTAYTQKKLKKGTYYKYFVVAIKKSTTMATSKTIHLATTGGKVGNDKALKLNKTSITLKKGKTFKLKATLTPYSKKLTVKRHRSVAYESGNPSVAKVSSAGTITAKKKGSCYIYAYAQDGVCAKVKVTVK